jgi:hypothetical protein
MVLFRLMVSDAEQETLKGWYREIMDVPPHELAQTCGLPRMVAIVMKDLALKAAVQDFERR